MVAELVLQSLRYALEVLEAQEIPAAVMGGIAVALWNNPRFTRDVDLLVAVDAENVQSVSMAFKQAGLHPLRDPPVLKLDETSIVQFNYEPPESFIKVRVDLLLAESEFMRLAIQRSVTHPVDGFQCEVVSCDDLILLKLLAGRIIDRADAAALLRINRDGLDVPHLLEWAGELSLKDGLNEIWDEAFPGESPPWPE